MTHKIISINDNLHGLIEITDLEKQIISNNLFNRLHDIYQNSTVYLTFPTNRTKRFEHSIGAMYLVDEMFLYALSNTDKNSEAYKLFIEDVNSSLQTIIKGLHTNGGYPCRIASHLDKILTIEKHWNEATKKSIDGSDLIDKLIALRISSIGSKTNGLSTQLANSKKNSNIEFIHLAIIYQAIRIAALLHDVGHPPYSHITERALDKLYSEFKFSNNLLVQAYDECKIDTFHDHLHEMIGDKIINTIFEEIVEKAPTNTSKIFTCIVWVCVMLILTNGRFNKENYKESIKSELWKTLHELIAGEVDCDRLDYIVRDGIACGISGAQIDYKRIISGLKLCVKTSKNSSEQGTTYCFAFLAKSLSSLENFFLKRHNLYESAIYHHRVIKTDTLMENVIIELVNEYFSTLHNPKNDTETSLPTDNIRGLWTALNRINSSSVENTSSLIQWNDSWLITVLKNEWYKRKLDTQTHDDDIARLTDQLDEILTNEKHYFSAVKRGYDFALIDNEFKKKIIKNSSAFSNYPQLSLGKKFIETITKTPPQAEQKFFVLRMFHKMIWPELKDAICKSDYLDKLIDPLEQIISSCAKTAKREFNQTMNGQIIVDVMIGMKNNKAIKADSVNLYRPYSSNDNQEQVITLKETSNMDSILQLFIMYSPLFYVYIKKSRSAPEKINANLYLQILGEKLGDYIIKKIKKMRKNEMSAHRK